MSPTKKRRAARPYRPSIPLSDDPGESLGPPDESEKESQPEAPALLVQMANNAIATQKTLEAVALSMKAVGDQVASMAQAIIVSGQQIASLNQMILDARAEAARPPETQEEMPGNGLMKGGGLNVSTIMQLLAAWKGVNASNGGGDLQAIPKLLGQITPLTDWLTGIRLGAQQELADIFTRTTRSGVPPEHVADGIQEYLGEKRRQVIPMPASAPTAPQSQ